MFKHGNKALIMAAKNGRTETADILKTAMDKSNSETTRTQKRAKSKKNQLLHKKKTSKSDNLKCSVPGAVKCEKSSANGIFQYIQTFFTVVNRFFFSYKKVVGNPDG